MVNDHSKVQEHFKATIDERKDNDLYDENWMVAGKKYENLEIFDYMLNIILVRIDNLLKIILFKYVLYGIIEDRLIRAFEAHISEQEKTCD